MQQDVIKYLEFYPFILKNTIRQLLLFRVKLFLGFESKVFLNSLAIAVGRHCLFERKLLRYLCKR